MSRIRTGIDGNTGQPLSGRAHAEQSVRDIIITRLGAVWMLLDYGSDLRALRGENLTVLNLLRAYSEMVAAVHAHEPAVRIVRVAPRYLDGRNGIVGFMLDILFYPYGHEGDYSVVEGFGLYIPATALTRGWRGVA